MVFILGTWYLNLRVLRLHTGRYAVSVLVNGVVHVGFIHVIVPVMSMTPNMTMPKNTLEPYTPDEYAYCIPNPYATLVHQGKGTKYLSTKQLLLPYKRPCHY